MQMQQRTHVPQYRVQPAAVVCLLATKSRADYAINSLLTTDVDFIHFGIIFWDCGIKATSSYGCRGCKSCKMYDKLCLKMQELAVHPGFLQTDNK